MNGWEMLHISLARGFPQDKSNGKRKRETEGEEGGMGGREGVSKLPEFTNGRNKVEKNKKKKKVEVLFPWKWELG